MKFSKIIVILILFTALVYTSAILYLFDKYQVEPRALTTAFFGSVIAELWALSKIKREETKKEIKDEKSREFKDLDIDEKEGEFKDLNNK